ncbi:YndM family protein [Paenisporosarcina sp. TG20]|uniref:YndM family protein n=1 Tax=Paenisporosarcina sp. TG20 TaxID=1211706 RepID=UPI0002FA62A9|nr:YndM family protein [Paenisporosarcina sp. TG20]
MNIKALLIKFIMCTAVLWIVLGLFYGVPFSDVLITSVFLTVFAYALDVLVLPRVGNVFALMGDFVLAWAGIWILGSFLFPELIPLGTASLIAAIIITIGEVFFHRYMAEEVFDKPPMLEEKVDTKYKGNLQTEFAEEVDIKSAAEAKKKEINVIKSKKRGIHRRR